MRGTCFRRVAAAIGLLVLLAGCAERPAEPAAPDPRSRRQTPAGELVGFSGPYGSHVWLGIPYAEPPVGDRRWRAPRAASPWPGVREATALGAPCPQLGSRFAGVDSVPPGTPVGEEDCLTLNIYAPAFAPEGVPTGERRLPVMVWIHGGGNTVGYGGLYDGGNLAATHGVVVVTLNYRLGPLGWFRHASLRGDDASLAERSGNFGTLDLIRALEWVRENIAAFGGDPQRVTIFGESAGGRDVFSLLLSPPAAGLFHRAIAQSGRAQTLPPALGERAADGGGAADGGRPNTSTEILLRLRVADGSAADRSAAELRVAAMAPEEIAAYLRAVPPEDLLAAYSTGENEGLIDVPQLFADGHVIASGRPLDLLATPGAYNDVPAIFGTNRDENKVFLFAQPAWVQQVLWVYPRVRDADLYDATAEALAGAWKAAGADAPAAAIARRGRSPVFVYRWDWDEEASLFGADLAHMLGAAHGFEIPFVFGHFELGEATVVFDEENEPGRQALSQQMMSYWAQFAYTGDPGRGRDGSLPQWRAWSAATPSSPEFMVFDTPAGGGSRMAAGVVTEESVAARVLEDPRLQTPQQRCRTLYEVAKWAAGRSGESVEARYAALAGGTCADLPASELAGG